MVRKAASRLWLEFAVGESIIDHARIHVFVSTVTVANCQIDSVILGAWRIDWLVLVSMNFACILLTVSPSGPVVEPLILLDMDVRPKPSGGYTRDWTCIRSEGA